MSEAGAAEPTSWLHPLGPAPASEPDPSRSRLDELAAAANAARRGTATDRLARSLEPLDAVVAPVGPPLDLIAHRIALAATDAEQLVDEVLAFEDNRPPRLGFVVAEQGGLDDAVEFRTTFDLLRPDVWMVAEQLAAGSMVAVAAVEGHREVLRNLTADLEELLGPGASVDVMLFAARARTEVRPRADVDWVLAVLDGAIDLEVGDRAHSVAAGAAAVLRWPDGSGTAHAAADRPAIALRISLPRPTVATLLAGASDRARHHPLLRADLPTDLDAPVVSYGGSLRDIPGRFAAEAAALLDDGLVAEARVRARQGVRVDPGPSFRATLAALPHLDAPLRVTPSGGWLVVDADGTGDATRKLVVRGLVIDAPAAVQEHLATRGGRGGYPLGRELVGFGLTDTEVAGLLRDLLSAGILEVADPLDRSGPADGTDP